MKNIALAGLLAPFLLSCGSDVVNYSAPVGISFKLTRSGVGTSNAVSLSKGIATEQGNPYGAFVNDATKALGHAPSRITASGVTLQLLATSTGVTTLDQVFTGSVVTGFTLTASTSPSTTADVTVGSAAVVAGTMTPMATGFDSANLNATEYADLVGATFPVYLDGTAATYFVNASNPTADLQVTFTFVAYK